VVRAIRRPIAPEANKRGVVLERSATLRSGRFDACDKGTSLVLGAPYGAPALPGDVQDHRRDE
jgi:hypothetical protein